MLFDNYRGTSVGGSFRSRSRAGGAAALDESRGGRIDPQCDGNQCKMMALPSESRTERSESSGSAVEVPHSAVSWENLVHRSRLTDRPCKPAAMRRRRPAVNVTPLNGTQQFSNRASSPVFVRAGS